MVVSVPEDIGLVQVCASLEFNIGTAIADTVIVVPTFVPGQYQHNNMWLNVKDCS